MTATGIITLLMACMTEWNTITVICTCGIAAVIFFAGFLAEFMIMGFTANAGGLFWATITCFLVTQYLPL